MTTAKPGACSFCGKHQDDVQKLITGPEVNICDECVHLCNSMLTEEAEGERVQLAELGMQSWKERKGVDVPELGKRGARFGPGYPSCPDMPLSRKICEWSEAGRIGVEVTDSDMLEPEMSTCAVLAHRPRARIFNRLV